MARAKQSDLLSALELASGPALISIVGGGGKSALLFRLAELLPGRVVLTTTTRIFRAQIGRAPASCSTEPAELEAALAEGESGLLVVGEVEGEKAFGVPTELPGILLDDPRVDVVVVEADGSRMLPAKAPADHEPVVPPETTHLIAVMGMDALDAPIGECTHRPQRVCEITGRALEDRLDEAAAGVLLGHSQGGCKAAPAGARVIAFINKVHDARAAARARKIAEHALAFDRVDRVVLGALEGDRGSDFEVLERDRS